MARLPARVEILHGGEALQDTHGDVAGLGEAELLADADAGAAVELNVGKSC